MRHRGSLLTLSVALISTCIAAEDDATSWSSSSSSPSPPHYAGAETPRPGTLHYPVDEHVFHTTLDHYNFRPTVGASTLPLRYYVNERHWARPRPRPSNATTSTFASSANSSSDSEPPGGPSAPGPGPCFFYAGNEADVNVFINNSGFIFELAEEFHALVVFAEHRYYGLSKPFGKHNDDAFQPPYNISFLTVEQAMADYNDLVLHIRTKWSMPQDTAFVAFGGSYGGNLAMWLRLKNPNLWAGAVASSATPLKHLLRETNAFARIETEAYGNVSKRCPELVRDGWQQLLDGASTAAGRASVARTLGLCHPLIDVDAAHDVHGWIGDALETMVQYGYPYPSDFYNPVPAYPFRVACRGMLMAGRSGLGALRAAVDVYYNHTGQAGPCYDFFGSVVTGASGYWTRMGRHDLLHQQDLRLRRWLEKYDDDDVDGGGRRTTAMPMAARKGLTDAVAELRRRRRRDPWGYQTCTEAYQPMPTDGVTDFELPYTPNETAIFERCREVWGVHPRPNWEETNFMGSHIAAGSNIFLTSGQLDPWRAAGIQETPRGADPESIVVRIVEGGAHHLDLRASHASDPPSVVAIRDEQRSAIRRWIVRWRDTCPMTSPPTSTAPPPLLERARSAVG